MKQKVNKPSQTMKFKEPKLKSTKTYSSRKMVRRIRDWFADYYRVAIPSFLCVVLVIVVICLLLQKKETNSVASGEEVGTLEAPVEENYTVSDDPLQENAYDELNQFITIYLAAMENGDRDTYTSMRDATDETELIRMEKKSNYIESYQNISCYTKPGPWDNSYVVYVYSEVKFYDLDTVAPGLNTLFLCTNENGDLYVGIDAKDDKVDAYIQSISAQEDVADLFNLVQVKYVEAVDSDEVLKTFLDELSTKLKTDVGEALAQLEAEQAGVTDENTTGDDSQVTEDDTQSQDTTQDTTTTDQTIVTEMVKATDRVNIRASASADATKLGTAAKGEVFVRLEILDNGWSCIEYNDTEAYIMTTYLETVEDAIGSVTVLENVNVRASASPSATKLGVAYAGEVYELIEEIENGWSKINYNGETAYIKSEYLEKK